MVILPHISATSLQVRTGRVAASHLPAMPAPPDMPAQRLARPARSEAERAQPSKAALQALARNRGLQGYARMTRDQLAKALAH